MALPTYGSMAVDWEQRIDFDRLRRERLARAKELLVKSEMGALLCFDMNNVRTQNPRMNARRKFPWRPCVNRIFPAGKNKSSPSNPSIP